MTGALGGIGDELVLVGRSGVPEEFGDVPGAVSVEDQESVALLRQLAMCTQQRFRGGTLHERARGCIYGSAEEVIGSGIADVELDARVELRDVDEIRAPKRALLEWRAGGPGFGSQLRDGPD